jgi:hypothetical protein
MWKLSNLHSVLYLITVSNQIKLTFELDNKILTGVSLIIHLDVTFLDFKNLIRRQSMQQKRYCKKICSRHLRL